MRIKTRDFGEIDINENDIVIFKEPILGFNDTKFVVISYEDFTNHFVFLQSVENYDVCFTLVDPSILNVSYTPFLNIDCKKKLECTSDKDLIIWLIGVIYDDFEKSTVNLKSPIIINATNNMGVQCVLDEDYPLKYLIYQREA